MYYLGMFCGMVFAFFLAAFLKWGIGKLGGKVGLKWMQGAYDERQLLARGKAYKAAYFTLIFYMLIIAALKETGIPIFMSFCGLWLGVCLSVAVFAVICILKDAYMSLYENVKGVILMFSAVALLNLIIGIESISEQRPLLEKGVLSTDWLNLIVGILFMVIVIVFCGKVLYNKKQEDEESSL